jgi:hypothetical protein
MVKNTVRTVRTGACGAKGEFMRTVTLMMVLAVAVACGQSETEKQAEAFAKAAEDAAKAIEKATDATAKQGAQSTDDMAKAMQTMANAFAGGTGADGKKIEPIAFQTLQSHLPNVSGWEMEEPEGQRMTMPVPFSQVETEYRKGDSRIELTIVDTGFAQLLIAPWSMMLAAGYEKETRDGYEKAVTIDGNPAIEKWDKSDKRGELNILVGKRYMVSIDGREVADIKDLHQFASAMNLNAIAALK